MNKMSNELKNILGQIDSIVGVALALYLVHSGLNPGITYIPPSTYKYNS